MRHTDESDPFEPGNSPSPFAGSTQGYDRGASDTCVILQYSRVATLIHDPLQLSVQPYHFEQQMEYLAENYNVLSADGLAHRLTRGKAFPRRSVVLMFDGGYTDLLYTVQGVLDRLSLPAMAFVPTAHLLERRPRWYDELEDLLITHRTSGECGLVIDDEVLRLSLHNRYERFAAYDRLVSLLSRRTPVQQQEILDQIAEALPSCEGETDNHAALGAQDLKRLDEGGCVCVEGSTHHHVDPDTLNPWEQSLEIGKNKEILEEVLGRRITSFSCPFWAAHDPSAASVDVLWKLGFSLGFYSNPGSMTLYTRSTQVTLPRVRVCDRSALALHQQVAVAGRPSIRSGVQNEDQTAYCG